MKVFSEYEPNESGKGKFLTRLFPELEKLGCKIKFKPQDCDIRLSLTRMRTKSKLPTVLRMDGIHLVDNKKNRWNNERVRKSIKKADTVIYQSDFSKRMIEPILKVKPKKSYVIYNGANPDDYVFPFLSKTIDVIMVARWANRKHKRLKEMLEIAKITPNLKFTVCGETSLEDPELENVKFLGRVSDKVLRNLLVSSKCMLNLTSYDWCPNAVVEAIVAGVPVIGYAATGVGELIQKSGGYQILQQFLEPEMIRSEFLPPIDQSRVIYAIEHILKNNTKAYKPSLFIENIAKQYHEALKETLCSI